MKIIFGILVATGGFFISEACYGAPVPCPVKRVLLSNMRQLECGQESTSFSSESIDVTFKEDGIRWNCKELGPTDPEFDHQAKYPAAPHVIDNNQQAFSYAHGGSGDAVNCFQYRGSMDDINVSATEGYFPGMDLNADISYMCITAFQKKKGLGDRVARALAGSCEEAKY